MQRYEKTGKWLTGCLKRDFLEDENRDGTAEHEAEEQGGADETVLHEELEIAFEGVAALAEDTECETAEGAVGVDSGNHGEESREEAGFGRSAGERGEEDGEGSDHEGGDEGGGHDVGVEGAVHEEETAGMAGGRDDGTEKIGAAWRVADSGETDSGYCSEQCILKNFE